MDRKLVAWARMVKSRLRRSRHPGARHAVLWLFTDERLADPVGAVRALAGLPRGLAGVVLRARTRDARAALGRRLAPICRRAGLELLVAADAGLARALRAGSYRAGAGRAGVRGGAGTRAVAASAHDRPELCAAMRAGVRLVFVSPVFPTASHPGAPALGPVRAERLAGAARGAVRVLALGGVTGTRARALGRRFTGAGAIDALAPSPGRRPA